jgi:hypothetical protein
MLHTHLYRHSTNKMCTYHETEETRDLGYLLDRQPRCELLPHLGRTQIRSKTEASEDGSLGMLVRQGAHLRQVAEPNRPLRVA